MPSHTTDKPGYDFTSPIEEQKTEAVLSCSWSRAKELREKQKRIMIIGVLKNVINAAFKRGKF